MVVGIALVGAGFYAVVHGHFLGLVVQRTLGPYSDTLAEHGFASDDPDIWQRMARRHNVVIIVQPPAGEAYAFDSTGHPAIISTETPSVFRHWIRAHRTGPDGTEVIFQFSLFSFSESHMPILAGMLVIIVAVIGSVFWFLQRQIRPLTLLRRGVDAVTQGDFKARVPVIRNDEIGKVATAFNTMTGRVGEMIDDRERLLADVSHELRSPIARMKVALEFMPEGDKRESLARDMREMEQLIAALLEREALRSRADRLEGERFDLRQLAADVVATHAGRGPGVELVEPVRPEPAVVHADPALLRMLIQNLVDNAIKFSHPDSRPVQVSVQSNGGPTGQTVIRVIDDGIGIPSGTADQLFKPFVKGDRSRGHGVGYGIGLSLCQRIVQLHEGTIELRARKPRGTEVVVTL